VAAGGFSADLLDGAFLLVVSGEDDLDAAAVSPRPNVAGS
jgi:hypothetical protein